MSRFPYYARLGKKRQATYRRSDEIVEVPLDDPDAAAPTLEAIEAGLHGDDRRGVQTATAALVRQLCDTLEVPRVTMRVLARRPSDATAELHGLYEREEGKTPIIRVWMRTAAHERPVAFRTFVRVVMHELCHHLDYDKYALGDSMHTQGFFRRESSLVRQLLGTPEAVDDAPSPQLDLFGSASD
ncbi:MAG: hypothetical protein AAGA54_04055 [Myxococcota bacterium]